MNHAMPNNATANRPPEVQEARNTLRRKGWLIKEAAVSLGVSRIHLSCVLNARRQSRRILVDIQKLPDNPKPA